MKWWVDGSHAVHPDCKGHTGGAMSMGKNAVVSASIRQKLNTRSSIETEVVSADDMMPQLLWTNYFLWTQNYGVKECLMLKE